MLPDRGRKITVRIKLARLITLHIGLIKLPRLYMVLAYVAYVASCNAGRVETSWHRFMHI